MTIAILAQILTFEGNPYFDQNWLNHEDHNAIVA